MNIIMSTIKIETTILITIISVAITVMTYLMNKKKDIQEEISNLERIKTHLEYIKDEIKSIYLDMDKDADKIDSILDRLARAEESVKNAHEVIEKIEKKINSCAT